MSHKSKPQRQNNGLAGPSQNHRSDNNHTSHNNNNDNNNNSNSNNNNRGHSNKNNSHNHRNNKPNHNNRVPEVDRNADGPQKKLKHKLTGKGRRLELKKQQEIDMKERKELEKRVQKEAPPVGTNPLSADYNNNRKPTDNSTNDDTNTNDDNNTSKVKGTLVSCVRHFNELAISARTQQALKDAGYTRMTDIQRAGIPHALAGRDVLGAARTGSGKTLAFLIPAIEKLYRQAWNSSVDGIGVIILSPTRELAIQIFDVLRKIGCKHNFSAGLIIGGKSFEEESQHINSMNILVSTPGRLLQHCEQTYGFECSNIQMLILDEADRCLDMGFEQAINSILEYIPNYPQRQTLLFSATQTKSIKDLARLSLNQPEYISVHENASDITPNKLEQHYTYIDIDKKFDLLFSFIKTHLKQKSIVFLSSGKQVRFLYEIFRRIRPGVVVMHLHGKMKQEKRMATFYEFCKRDSALLFATDLAARGLDFPEVDWVLQLDCPDSVPTYIHRVGRTARYRARGKALLCLLPSESAFLEELSNKKLKLKKVNINNDRVITITAQFQAFLAQDADLKFLGQKAFISYIRSVHLQSNKSVFNVNSLDTEKLAAAMGLPGTPRIKLLKSSKNVEKNMPHALKQMLESKKKLAIKKPTNEVDKLLNRKAEHTVLGRSRERLRAQSDESEDNDQILRPKQHSKLDAALLEFTEDDRQGQKRLERILKKHRKGGLREIDAPEWDEKVDKPALHSVESKEMNDDSEEGEEESDSSMDEEELERWQNTLANADMTSDKYAVQLKSELKAVDEEDKEHDHARVKARHHKLKQYKKSLENRPQEEQTVATLATEDLEEDMEGSEDNDDDNDEGDSDNNLMSDEEEHSDEHHPSDGNQNQKGKRRREHEDEEDGGNAHNNESHSQSSQFMNTTKKQRRELAYQNDGEEDSGENDEDVQMNSSDEEEGGKTSLRSRKRPTVHLSLHEQEQLALKILNRK